MQQKPVLLIAFYNKKALGVRCLERSLADSGHDVVVLFMKDFDSRAPGPVTEKELMLLKDLVSETDPGTHCHCHGAVRVQLAENIRTGLQVGGNYFFK
jgi:hypothetical protein